MKKIALTLLAVGLLTWLYSHKLLVVPSNLTVDEAVFGYNATLLANTGRDENGRLLPFFVLTAGTNDWHQPFTQYFLVSLFKVFGPSVFLLRFSSVIIAVASVVGLYYLGLMVLGSIGALVAATVLAITPIIMFQAHMGQENIMPLPFIIAWLFFLFTYRKNKSLKWLVFSGIFLGASFYTYKGMRAITPVWIILTALSLIRDRKPLFVFLGTVAPFFLIIPLLERFYAGAVLGGSSLGLNNFYDFFLPYLSSYDISYLFIRGDINELHSTGRHGMLLLASLPLVLVGIYAALRSKNQFLKFILLAVMTGPLLFGLVGSVHRFSRLLALLPLYALLAGAGWEYFWQSRQKIMQVSIGVIVILMGFNYLDFARYYWNIYPPITLSFLGELKCHIDLALLATEAKERNLSPVIHRQIAEGSGVGVKFFQMIYFNKLLPVVNDNDASEKGTLLLSDRDDIPDMTRLNLNTECYKIQTK